MVAMASWGRLGQWEHEVRALSDRSGVARQIRGGLAGIAYGMGRSYGDVCLNPGGVLWNTTGLDRFIHFDETTGRLACEAGVLLRDIQQLALPRGWMLPVTPGTQLVTVGGAIANDVHGKNHHVCGSFGDHVRRLKLVRTDGVTMECGPDLAPDWFAATVGGLGLTGIMVEAELQLRRAEGPWLDTETLPYDSLEQFLAMADHSESGWEHTVAWIDCMAGKRGRGLFMRARAGVASGRPEPRRRELRVPFAPPVSLVNRWSLRPFNSLYYNLKRRRSGRAVAHYASFFYPLDTLHEWNRLYGRGGFFQYQSVVPRDDATQVLRAMLDEIARSGDGSFLAVLKTFGERRPPGMLSFPRHGVTLALDFPNRGERTLKLFERLDALVREAGGRLYPAKDARMPRAMFEAGYPRLDEFMQFRDPGISSAMSRRLMGS